MFREVHSVGQLAKLPAWIPGRVGEWTTKHARMMTPLTDSRYTIAEVPPPTHPPTLMLAPHNANQAFYHQDPPASRRVADIRADAIFLMFADVDRESLGHDDAVGGVLTGAGFRRMVEYMCKCVNITAFC